MNQTLMDAWRKGDAPFASEVYSAGLLTPGQARRVLAVATRELLTLYRGEQLFTMLDHHSYDGYVGTAEPTAWDQLTYAVRSDHTLVSWASPLPGVHRLWFPEGREGLLRWAVFAEAETVDVEIIAPDKTLTMLDLNIKRIAPDSITSRHLARHHFDHSWRNAKD
mgnify:FL=1